MASTETRAKKHGSSGSRTRRAKSKTARKPTSVPRRRWSAAVMKRSDALDLESGVFKKRSPQQIALSLKRSAESSTRRKGSPYQSAMSMLTFHINRAGRTLPAKQKKVLTQAKDELRAVFGRT